MLIDKNIADVMKNVFVMSSPLNTRKIADIDKPIKIVYEKYSALIVEMRAVVIFIDITIDKISGENATIQPIGPDINAIVNPLWAAKNATKALNPSATDM